MKQEILDYVIVGAGPAGLQMAHFLREAGRSYVVLEAGETAGRFFKDFPRHRMLISINKRFNYYTEDEYNLRHDWNSLLSNDPSLRFTRYSTALFPPADELHKYLQDYAARLKLDVRYRTPVERIGRSDDVFELRDQAGTIWRTRCVLMATGPVRGWVPPGIEGIELASSYEDHPLDLGQYENKRVAIIGRGNSALETANHLAGHAAIIHLVVGDRAPRLAYDSHYVGDMRAVNHGILDMWQLKSLHAVIGVRPTKISRNGDGSLTMAFEERVGHWDPPATACAELQYDYIIRCTGWSYVNSELFDADCAPAHDKRGKYPLLSPSWESSTGNVFYIGTATGRDRRAAAGFIHGFRYNVRTLFHLLEERFHGVPYPATTWPLRTAQDLKSLTESLFARVSTSSGLYQMNAVLCDALVVEDGKASVLEELPVDYVMSEDRFRRQENLCLITLEYGFHHYAKDLSALQFIHTGDPSHTRTNPFLHPVFRRFSHGELKEELHFHEHLEVRFDTSSFMFGRLQNLINRMAKVTDEHFEERFRPFPPLAVNELTEQDLMLRPARAANRNAERA